MIQPLSERTADLRARKLLEQAGLQPETPVDAECYAILEALAEHHTVSHEKAVVTGDNLGAHVAMLLEMNAVPESALVQALENSGYQGWSSRACRT